MFLGNIGTFLTTLSVRKILAGFSGVKMIQFLRKETKQMGRIDLRKFDDVRHLVRARLLSSDFHDFEKSVKEHIAADVWKT